MSIPTTSLLCTLAALVMLASCESEHVDCNTAPSVESLRVFGEEDVSDVAALCTSHPLGVHIDRGIWIQDTQLQHLGLDCVCSVSDIVIKGNDKLVDLRGFDNLRTIRGGLRIVENARLETLQGLPSVETLGEFSGSSIYIDGNPMLRDLVGLPPNLLRLEGSLYIANNEDLDGLDGLPSDVALINGGIKVESNPNLQTLAGLPPTVEALETLTISGNGRLTDLEGLPTGLRQIKGALWVTRNSSLTRLAGLPPLLTSIGEVHISSNDSLLDLSGFADDLTINGPLTIEYNDTLQNLGGLPEGLAVGKAVFDGHSLRVVSNKSLLDLSGLPASLQSLPGGVLLYNTPVTNLDGLFDNLRVVHGLELIRNKHMQNLSGIPEGTTLNRDLLDWSLFIVDNDSLTSLAGLPSSLIALPGGISVVDNDSLPDLTGLEGVKSVDGNLYIGKRYPSNIGDPCDWSVQVGGNANIQSLAGLSSIEEVSGDLVVACNPELLGLDAFPKLEKVGGSLLLLDNEGLADLTGLGGVGGNLRTIEGTYGVRCSPQLDLAAVEAVTAEVTPPPTTSFQLVCP